VIGKGILRFHAVYWPAMLLSAGVALPTDVVVHGYLTIGGQKMSKSLGNVIDPSEVAAAYGADALRYYLLREFSPFADGDFTVEKLAGRYRADLANDLGNLLNRTISMIQRYREGVIPVASAGTSLEDGLWRATQDAESRVGAAMTGFDPQAALIAIWEVVSRANSYVEDCSPWSLAREEKAGASTKRLDTVLSTLATTLGRLAWMLAPFLPETSHKIATQLGSPGIEFAPFPGQHVAVPQPVFPRIEDEVSA
jgi:methionyl-tRNA synthetase